MAQQIKPSLSRQLTDFNQDSLPERSADELINKKPSVLMIGTGGK